MEPYICLSPIPRDLLGSKPLCYHPELLKQLKWIGRRLGLEVNKKIWKRYAVLFHIDPFASFSHVQANPFVCNRPSSFLAMRPQVLEWRSGYVHLRRLSCLLPPMSASNEPWVSAFRFHSTSYCISRNPSSYASSFCRLPGLGPSFFTIRPRALGLVG